MSVLASLFCLQACIFQISYTQCIGPYPNMLDGVPPPFGPAAPPYGPLPLEGPGLAPLGKSNTNPSTFTPMGSYGGAGVGDITVIGEMPVAGTTLVAGQVPILGSVQFSGPIPAAGIMSVTGSCSCGAKFNVPFI